MILSFHPCITADHQIILGHRQPDTDDASLIARSELIILPQTCSEKLYFLCADSKASLFPNYKMRFEYPGKVGQSILFEKLGIPQPETLRWKSIDHFVREMDKMDKSPPHSYPFLLKEDRRHEAEGIHMIKNADDVEITLEKIKKKNKHRETQFISQEFIQAYGNALRIVIMEDSFISYWKRPGGPGQEISTISKGARIDKKWRPGLQKKGKAMAKKLSKKTGINLAAVDFIFNLDEPEPQPLLLELNYYFGRTGLGGTISYYELLFKTIKYWMNKKGYDSTRVKLV